MAESDPQFALGRAKAALPIGIDELATTAAEVPAPGSPPLLDDKALLEVKHRGWLLAAVMMVAICQFIDATIANVALPHMQAALGASPDTISWVLTSFIIAGAIGMPITGWLSDRLGSRNLYIGATVLFMAASAACGAANSLVTMVICRTIQGFAAAFLGPMTQTIMFDVSPPSKQAQTMATFGMIVMVAPISGPFLGGYLTDYLNWRWIYYVNLPIGIPALVMLWWLLPSRPLRGRRLDLWGFSFLAVGLAALQLMLDRGQENDWFSSWETSIEAGVAISAFWMFLVHSHFTSKPLFSASLVRNPSFLAGCGFMLVMGITNIALSAVLPTMYQTIYRYPVIFTGMLMAPRGFGVMVTSLFTGRLLRRMDYRYLITIGYTITAGSMWIMTTWSPDMDWHRIVLASFIQGLGLGMVFAPMNLIAFAGLKPELRPDGSSLIALFRNLGGAVGISIIMMVMARNQQISHADLATHITGLATPAMDLAAAGSDASSPLMMNATITRQSQMVAYIDNFYMIGWLLLGIAPLSLLLKKPQRAQGIEPMHLE